VIGAPSAQIYGSIALAAAAISPPPAQLAVGGQLFARPGVGLAVHSRDSHGVPRLAPTSARVLFAPELGVGYQLSRRISLRRLGPLKPRPAVRSPIRAWTLSALA
jgi:hypothetical protein